MEPQFLLSPSQFAIYHMSSHFLLLSLQLITYLAYFLNYINIYIFIYIESKFISNKKIIKFLIRIGCSSNSKNCNGPMMVLKNVIYIKKI